MSTTARDRVLADVGRMYREACSRIDDGTFLAQHWPSSASGSDYLLRVLGLEVLLKAALRLFGVPYATAGGAGHRYVALWASLPPEARREVIAVALERMHGASCGGEYEALDLSNGRDVDRALNQAEAYFACARYQYEYSEGLTDAERLAVEERWIERGAPLSEAESVTRAPEVDALIAGLRRLIETRLPL